MNKLVAVILSDEIFNKSTKLENTLSIPKNKSWFSFFPTKIKTHTKIILLEENYINNFHLYKIIIVYDDYEYLRNIAFKLTEDFWPYKFLAGKLGTKEISDELKWNYIPTDMPITISIPKPPQVKEKTNNICPHCEKEIIRQNRRNHFDNCINLIFS